MNVEYLEAIEFTKKHYENFPVISFFVGKDLRKHIAVIYKFARTADDIADSDKLGADEKLRELKKIEVSLLRALMGKYDKPFWRALHNTITAYGLSAENLFALLEAFKTDAEKKTFYTFDEISNYCSKSANPVGRIILEFYDLREKEYFRYSDKICTALQLTNFYQDISVDRKNGRVFFPVEELAKFNLTPDDFLTKSFDENFRELIKYSTERTEKLFEEGKALIPLLPFPLKQQIKITVAAGMKILNKIKKLDYNTLDARPEITKPELLSLVFNSVINADI